MNALEFCDTNVLLYAHDTASPAKQKRAQELLERLWRTRQGCLSTQVLQEFYVNIVKRIHKAPEARALVRPYFYWPLSS